MLSAPGGYEFLAWLLNHEHPPLIYLWSLPDGPGNGKGVAVRWSPTGQNSRLWDQEVLGREGCSQLFLLVCHRLRRNVRDIPRHVLGAAGW